MIYGNTFLPEEEKFCCEDINLESFFMELYEIESIEEEYVPEIVEEGANRDYNTKLKEFSKELRKLNKDIKMYRKAKDKTNYIKTIDKGLELCSEAKKEIDKIQPTTSETIISWLIKIIKSTLIFIIGIKVSVGISTAAKSVTAGDPFAIVTGVLTAKNLPNINYYEDKVGKRKNSSKEEKLKRFNQFRTTAINYIYMCRDILKIIKGKVNEFNWD